jgi:EmrB/QacA subfamily drug resistance transporter
MTITLTQDRPAVDQLVAPAVRRRWLGFSAVVAATVMDLLDSTVINVAAPAIRADLGGSMATLQWMAAGYTLALAVGLLIGARLGDMFGRKQMLLVGVAGFTASSLLCATAWTPDILLVARVLQGGFGAVMLPQTIGIIRDLFPAEQMRKAWAVFGPVMGLSAVLGPIIGGVLIDANLFGTGWRMIFLINLPVGAFTLVMAARHLVAGAATDRGARLDLTSIALAVTGTFALLFPLVQGHELGWPVWSFVMLAGSIVILAGLAVYQVRRKRSGRTPLIEPSVFAKRTYTAGVAFAIAFTAGMGGLLITIGVFLQVGLGYTPLHASLSMAPWALGGIVGTTISGILMAKLGRALLHIGLATMAAGVLAFAVIFATAGSDVDGWLFLLANLIGGIGMGMIFTPMLDFVLAGVGDREVGSATGVLQSMQQLGVSLGVAVIGTVFFGLLSVSAQHAASVAALVTAGLLAVAFALGFLLPKQVRHQG